MQSVLTTGASPLFIVCHKVISLSPCLVYSLFQYIIGDGIFSQLSRGGSRISEKGVCMYIDMGGSLC